MQVTKMLSFIFNKQSKTVIVVVVSAFLVLVSLYHIVFAKRIIPGVEISGVNVGGMNFSQAQRALSDKTTYDTQFSFNYEDTTFEFSPRDINVEYDINATLVRAYEVGRTGNFYVDSKDKIAGILKPLKLKSFYKYDETALDATISYMESNVNIEPQNAHYYIENGELHIKNSEIGKKVDSSSTQKDIIYGLDGLRYGTRELKVEEKKPGITNEILELHFEQVEEIVFNPLFIHYKDKSWELSSDELLNFIDISFEDEVSQLSLNEPIFEAFAEEVANEVNELPRGRVEEDEDHKVTSFEIIEEGYELDIKQFNVDFKKALLNNETLVELSMKTISGSKDPEEYGIISLIGEGESEYTGSAPSRAHNLNLAAERISGVLVPPGEVFSFNKSVGPISAATGYQTAYVISNGRTVLGDGGGVCQTSTTLFRAVLNSGLPVVKRNPHAYRVRYYELDAPLGFDAAIYQPYLDFQFRNDTENYILVQSEAEPENNLLRFKFYGTPDGREVELSDSVVTNEISPPEPLYQDEPSLAEGVVKQVDFAAWGATASFDRVVKKDGEVIYEDTFTTRYQPWRAIYLVGTKKD